MSSCARTLHALQECQRRHPRDADVRLNMHSSAVATNDAGQSLLTAVAVAAAATAAAAATCDSGFVGI